MARQTPPLTEIQTKTLFGIAQGNVLDQATLKDVQSALTKGRGLSSIQNIRRRNFVQTLLQLVDKSGKDSIRRAIQAGDQVRINQVIQENVSTAIQSGATPGVTEGIRAPRIVALETQASNLRTLIEDKARPLNVAVLQEQINTLGSRAGDVPEAAIRSGTLSSQLESRIADEQTATRAAFDRAKINPVETESALKVVESTGQRITPEVNPKQFRAFTGQQEIKQLLETEAPRRNLRFLVEEGRLERPAELRRGLARVPGFRGAGLPQAQTSIEAALKVAGKGTPEALATARTQATGALTQAGRGPGARLLKGGGLAAALLLLPQLGRLLTGGEEAQPGLPPLLQAQLLQLLSSIQNQEALTQSLVGSRGAQAQKNLAQADLLRLQALTQQGGAMPQVV